MKNDGRTWERKHVLIHEIQDLLGLTDKDAANLLGVCDQSLANIYAKMKEKEEK